MSYPEPMEDSSRERLYKEAAFFHQHYEAKKAELEQAKENEKQLRASLMRSEEAAKQLRASLLRVVRAIGDMNDTVGLTVAVDDLVGTAWLEDEGGPGCQEGGTS